MGFCINCGNQHHDGVRFCRFCGTGQPSEQLLARLRAEAEQIRLLRMQMQQQNNQQNDAYARLEAMRQQPKQQPVSTINKINITGPQVGDFLCGPNIWPSNCPNYNNIRNILLS